jgi:two-component system, chemotaxis family, chemotaxis protein CheY
VFVPPALPMISVRSHPSLTNRWSGKVCPLARIVIVDDNLMIRTQLDQIFSSAGHDVIGLAADGLDAPLLVRDLHPDLVTLDLVMPGRDGLTTLEHLLIIDPGLAVIVCSASLQQQTVIRALKLGATDFIRKPFDRETVLDVAGRALNHAGITEPRTA